MAQDVSRSYELYITISVCTFAIVVTTILRIGAKVAYGLSLAWDDYFMILGTCLNIVGNAFDYVATASGFGRHAKSLTEDQLIHAVKYAQLAVIVAILALWAIKVSICFFLLGIIKGTHIRFAWLIRILMGFTTATTFVAALLWGLQAHPLDKLWDPRIPGTRDSPDGFLVTDYVYYAFCTITDICYALSPVYFLWSLQMTLQRKLSVIALTGSGILVTIAAALDIAFARAFLNTEDPTWVLVNEFICDNIQRNISGFIANLPALWFLFRQLEKKTSSSSSMPHDTISHSGNFGNFGNDIQKPIALSAVHSTKHRQPDPFDLEADDHIPLRERMEQSSMYTMSGGSVAKEYGGDGQIARQETLGRPRGWDDPTLEADYKTESTGEQN